MASRLAIEGAACRPCLRRPSRQWNPLESGYFLVDILRMCENDDIKDVYAEAKGNGFDTKAIRTIVRLRKQDAQERQEAESILDLYMNALGMA